MKALLTATTVLLAWAYLLGTAEAQMGGPPPGPPPGGGGDVVTVDCDNGGNIQGALDEAKDGDTINVSGTCNERATIILDNLTIDGGGTAIIDGTGIDAPGSLLQVRALNVSILNLTVQNSPRSGINVGRGGSAIIQGVTSTGNGTHGISVTRAAYALIGPGGFDHPVAGTGTGNQLFGNTRHGISVVGSASADIFHNLITSNVRGINISNSGSAFIDGNVITGNSEGGIQFFSNGAVTLSSSRNHHDTGLGNARPVVDPENNLIEGNDVGLRCRRGGAAQGNEQNFGTGNTTNFIIPPEGECHVRSTVF